MFQVWQKGVLNKWGLTEVKFRIASILISTKVTLTGCVPSQRSQGQVREFCFASKSGEKSGKLDKSQESFF